MGRFPLERVASWFLRLALAASYLSSIADRIGIWGAPGSRGVTWGAWAPFVASVKALLFFMPPKDIPTLAVVATVTESLIAIGLLIGWKLKLFAWASALLAGNFFVTMWMAGGPKGPLDYSVLTVSAASLLLASRSNRFAGVT